MGGIPADRLELEIAKSDAVIASWSPGLKASFDSLFDDTIESKSFSETDFLGSIIQEPNDHTERENLSI